MKKVISISLAIVMILMCLTSCGQLPTVTAEQFESAMKDLGAKISDMPPSGFSDTSLSAKDIDTTNAYIDGSTLTFSTCKTTEQAEELFTAFIAEREEYDKAHSNYSSSKSESSSPEGKTCKIVTTRLGDKESASYTYASQIGDCVITVSIDKKAYTGKLKEVLDSFGIKL